MPRTKTASAKKTVSSKRTVKREPSVVVISSDDDKASSLSNDQAVPAKSSSGDAALRVLEVLGHGRELALSPPTDVEPVGSQSAKKSAIRQSDRVKKPSTKVKAITDGKAVRKAVSAPSSSRKAASAVVRPGSPTYAAVVSGASAGPSDSMVKKLSPEVPSPSDSRPAKRSKDSKIASKKGATPGAGVVLQALKALDKHYESVGEVSPVAFTPAAKETSLLPSLMDVSPPVPRVKPPSVVLFAEPHKKHPVRAGGRLKRRKSASLTTSPPPSSPPADTPSPRKRRMIASLSPSDDDDAMPKGSSHGMRPPQTPTPASRAKRNLFINDEADEAGDEAEEEDVGTESDEAHDEESESESRCDLGSDDDPATPPEVLRTREQTPGIALGTSVPGHDSSTAADDEIGSEQGHVASDDDGGHVSDGSDCGLSDNSLIRHAKASSGPQVYRVELQDPVLDAMGVYDEKPDVTFCSLVAFTRRAGSISVADFATCRKTYNHGAIVRACCGLIFKRAGQFVNMSRCSPDMFIIPKFKILNLADTNRMAIDIILGVCTDCSLHRIVTEGNHRLHHIVVMPFGQQFLVHSAVWGNVFNFQTMVANVLKSGLGFTTRWEGAGTSNEDGDKGVKSEAPAVAPAPGPSDRWTQQLVSEAPADFVPSKQKKKSQSQSHRRDRFLWAHSFETEIPIYDGRGKHGPDFQFTPEQFDALEELPLYPGDVPTDSLVAVSTTVMRFQGSSGDSLFTSVQFVILLGLPIPSSVTASKKKSSATASSKGKGKCRA